MRQPPAPPSALHVLVAALPDTALRPLLMELLELGTLTGTTPVVEPAERPRRPYRRRPGSKPPGRRRGRSTKAAETEALEAKRAARREQAKLWARRKRAAAKQATTTDHGNGAGTSNGNDGTKPVVSPARFWAHAKTLQPKTPWRAAARELGTNEAQMLDCYRTHDLPPGITAGAIEKFLELPAP
jgi:hypothetical protein